MIEPAGATHYLPLAHNPALVPTTQPDDGSNVFATEIIMDEAAGVNWEGGAAALVTGLSSGAADLRVFNADTEAELAYGIKQHSQTPGSRRLVLTIGVPSLSSAAPVNVRLYRGCTGGPFENKAGAIPNNLSGYWPLESVASLLDWSPNARHMTNQGATDGTGKVGGAAYLNGTASAWLQIPASTLYNYTTKFTVCNWLNFADVNSFRIVWRRRYNSQYPIDWKVVPGNRIEIGALCGGNWRYLQSGPVLVANQWHFVVATYDATLPSNNLKVYVDDNAPTTLSETGSITVANLTGGIGSNPYPTGLVDEFQLHPVGRSGDWVATTYNCQGDNGAFWTVGAEQALGAARFPAARRGALIKASPSFIGGVR